jgi:putative phosphoesterase
MVGDAHPATMRLGIVSDTHGHLGRTQQAVRQLEESNVEQVIHCGDVGSSEIPALFATWPTHFVRGNVDHDARLRAAVEAAGKTYHGAFGGLEIEGVAIAFLHGDDERLLEATIAGGQWRLVCHGHTHVARIQERSSTLVLNPGALFRANPHSIAVVELPQLAAEILVLSP